MIGLLLCLLLLWFRLRDLLWFWFFNSHLKTALHVTQTWDYKPNISSIIVIFIFKPLFYSEHYCIIRVLIFVAFKLGIITLKLSYFGWPVPVFSFVFDYYNNFFVTSILYSTNKLSLSDTFQHIVYRKGDKVLIFGWFEPCFLFFFSTNLNRLFQLKETRILTNVHFGSSRFRLPEGVSKINWVLNWC